ncbi:alpha/beta hydrolase [Nonomuraea sp. NPDC050383]|uniref:alpha/beta hydrolase n=1 Tax=Nonomuraea sp. NPDC050383 TaxID=3364362 RepID=UPI0037A4BA4D
MADHSAAALAAYERAAAALAAYGRAAALAAGHHAGLDPAARLAHAHAWVGGGAPAFAEDLARHRARLQSSLTDALHGLALLVVRHGGPAPAVPALTTSVAALAPAPGRFQGVEQNAMTTLVASLGHAAQTLPVAGACLAAELSAHGLPAEPGHELRRIATWAAAHSDDLRRRLNLIRQTVPGPTLPAGLAAYGLFGGHAPDPGGAERLLARIAAGEEHAVTRLLTVQENGTDAGLAARVAAWWHTLPREARERLVTLRWSGLLNGLPATVRDRANRRGLAEERTRLERELETATADLGRLADPGLLGGWERIAARLRRIDLIESQLRPVAGHPAPLLLAFDATGQGRLVVSWGDPDTADITVTSVSGLTSGLDAARGDLERSRALWQQARATSGERSIASITWLGYDAPQIDPGLFDITRSVAADNAAAKGGRALAAFADGLHAAHAPSGTARSVVIGHSYGSLTTGHAAALRPGRLADDLILIGSPGTGVDHASRLGVDPAHVWVGEAGNDPVAALGRFGRDPGDESFGARRFPVGREVFTEAHSSYWKPHSPSLRNMGRLINGQYDMLTAPVPLNCTPQLLMPELGPESPSSKR